MKIRDIQSTHTTRATILAQGTAGTPDTWTVFKAPANITVVAVTWIPNAAVTGANTNNFSLQIQNRGSAGVATTAITAVKTYALATDSVAHDSEPLTLSTTAANLDVADGDVVAVVRAVNGSGLASPDGLLEIDFRYR